MGERKVLNKYYPPDFDPSKIPRLRLPKDRQYTVRLMAPFNMRCLTCGEYIYKGKKFNARKETVQNEYYLGIRIYRFYIKCTRCLSEITFKTDPQNTDYECEHGATRNFQAQKLAEEEDEARKKEREEEELNNPMKALENRTKDSKAEMDMLDALEEIKDLNARNAKVDIRELLDSRREETEREIMKTEEEQEAAIRSIFQKEVENSRRISDPDETVDIKVKNETTGTKMTMKRCTDVITQDIEEPIEKRAKTCNFVGKDSGQRLILSSIVKVKTKDCKDAKKSTNSEKNTDNSATVLSSQHTLNLVANYSGTSSEED